MINFPKVALVTGSARRIGAEIARSLHGKGLNIVIHYQYSERDADELCAEFNAKRAHSAIKIKADLGNSADISVLVQQAANSWGRLDVLVNNASRFYKTQMGEVAESHWNDLMDSNLKAPFFLSQQAAPFLKQTRGVIINIADIHSDRPMRDYSVYCISKAGLVMLTKVLAKELGPFVRVNAISPGGIAWPEHSNSLSEELKEKIIHRTALQCYGDPAHIAKAVLYFVNDADYVTGQVLAVDGGRILSS